MNVPRISKVEQGFTGAKKKRVGKLVLLFSGSLKITLIGGEENDISRRQTQRFKEVMSF